MHRLGFAPQDIPKLITRLKRQTSVIPRSVFSHLAGSDSTQFDAFTRHQIETFECAYSASYATKTKQVDPTGNCRWYVGRRDFRNPEDYTWPVPQGEQNINPNLRD